MKIFTASYSNLRWLSFALLSVVILFILNRVTLDSIGTEHIFFGLLYSILLLIILEIKDLIRDRNVYGYLQGTYERVKITEAKNERLSGIKYDPMNYENVHSEVTLEYIENRMYEVKLSYDLGLVTGYIFLDHVNLNFGKGGYQYTELKPGVPPIDIGDYTLRVDVKYNTQLYIYYKNIIPSGNAEGYEIWVRKSKEINMKIQPDINKAE